MAINLLGYLNTKLPGSTTQTQTTTPAAVMQQPKSTFANPVPAPVMPVTSQTYQQPLGVKAMTPAANQKQVATVLPSNQVSSSQSYGAQSKNLGYNPDPLIAGSGQAKTPEQFAQAAGGAMTGIGSKDPTLNQNPTPTYTGILGQLVQRASQPSQAYLDQMAQANQYNQQLQRSQMNEANALGANYSNPIPLEFQQGRGQVIQNQYGMQQQALANAFQGASNLVGQANTQQQTQQGALTAALGAAQPQLGQYGQTYYNPLTAGQAGSGSGNIQLTGQAQTDVGNIAQAVANGNLDYQSGLSQLSGYGTAVQNQLMGAIQKINPNFNFNLSASSASTQAQGQQLQTAANATNEALNTLQSLYDNLGGLQQTGIPMLNALGNLGATAFGSSALSTYKQTLEDARGQLAGVLTASGAVTPTGAEAMAQAYLPDNMTPAQLVANIGNVRTLINQKVNSFTQSGQQNYGTTGSGPTNFNW